MSLFAASCKSAATALFISVTKSAENHIKPFIFSFTERANKQYTWATACFKHQAELL